MKHQHKIIVCVCLTILSSHLLFLPSINAQISRGGTPYSFGSDFQKLGTTLPPLLSLEKPNLEKILTEDSKIINNNRFAVAIPVNYSLENVGQWTTLANGDRLWRLHLKVEEALSLRVIFEQFWLPEGARFYIYTPNRQYVQGAFTNQNNHPSLRFANVPLESDEMMLEYYEPRQAAKQGIIKLMRIDYGYKAFYTFEEGEKRGLGQNGFGASGSCNVNINCSLGTDWQDEKRGVVKTILTNASGSDWCSGSLINNTAEDRDPLILSANHCIVGQGALVETWGFIFNYEAPGCSNPASAPSTAQSLVGATMLARNAASDFALMRLNDEVPFAYNAYFNGWDRSATLPSSSVSIHHPSGDIKKIAVDNSPATLATFTGSSSGAGTTHFRVVWDQNTTTEPASSGAPLFNPQKLIIGQLHGGGASCANLSAPDFYGRVHISWAEGGTLSTSLAQWLDPLGTGILALGGIENIQPQNDVMLDHIASSVNNCDFSASTPVDITVRNLGSNAQSNLTLSYTLKGNNNQVISTGNTSIASLTSGASAIRTFNIDLSSINQNYNFEASVGLNTGTDENLNNNNRSKEFRRSEGISEYPYGTGFEQNDGGWTSDGINSQWAWGTPSQSVINRAASGTRAWVTNLSGQYSNNQQSFLQSPVFNFSNLSNPEITADIFVNTERDYDGMQFQVSTDLGLTWQPVGTTNSGTNWYNNSSSNLPFGNLGFANVAWSGEETSWKTIKHQLTAYGGQCQVMFRFLFISDFSVTGAGVAVDNVNINQIGGPTALQEELLNAVQVFPNPSSEMIYIEVGQSFNLTQNWHLSLWDMQGRKVWQRAASLEDWLKGNDSIAISVQGQSKGVYVLRISTNGQSIDKKIVVID